MIIKILCTDETPSKCIQHLQKNIVKYNPTKNEKKTEKNDTATGDSYCLSLD